MHGLVSLIMLVIGCRSNSATMSSCEGMPAQVHKSRLSDFSSADLIFSSSACTRRLILLSFADSQVSISPLTDYTSTFRSTSFRASERQTKTLDEICLHRRSRGGGRGGGAPGGRMEVGSVRWQVEGGGGGVSDGRPVGRVNSIPAMHKPAASQRN